MTAAVVLLRLEQAGVRVALRPDGHLSLRPAPGAGLLADAKRYKDDITDLMRLRMAVANDRHPSDPPRPCPTCGRGLFWRLSVLSGGPGPWHCHTCVVPDPGVWIDAHAMPVKAK